MEKREIEEKLKELQGWELVEDKKLRKTFKFKNFQESIRFLTLIQPVADSINHHPDVCVYYSRVVVELTTHEKGGLTELDFKLAKELDRIFEEMRS
ncbi:MAG: 4a-hydroxytetrahydrobiopterin dehydratase [Sulfolobaceae archaeon]|nr:4a-hydroxytetrahydrobiopterin dehydratase [Sulfolobaceae archaeon]